MNSLLLLLFWAVSEAWTKQSTVKSIFKSIASSKSIYRLSPTDFLSTMTISKLRKGKVTLFVEQQESLLEWVLHEPYERPMLYPS